MKNKMDSQVRLANKMCISITAMSGKYCSECSTSMCKEGSKTGYMIKIICYQSVNQTVHL